MMFFFLVNAVGLKSQRIYLKLKVHKELYFFLSFERNNNQKTFEEIPISMSVDLRYITKKGRCPRN